MFEFHKDKERYFNFQYWTARDYIIPFLESEFDFSKKLDVLEVGCAEAGVLKAFVEKGNYCLGIELHDNRIQLAKHFQSAACESGQLEFINRDIYKIDVEKDLKTKFDLIILKDVIEHIPNQENVVPQLKKFLKPNGKIFFGFPPWYMPFGGHQQITKSKALRFLPWFHLLPTPIYKGILSLFGEPEHTKKELLEIKETGISVERFERISKASDLNIFKKQFFFTNPIYQYKFGFKVIKQNSFLANIPFLRNFYSTAVYYLIG